METGKGGAIQSVKVFNQIFEVNAPLQLELDICNLVTEQAIRARKGAKVIQEDFNSVQAFTEVGKEVMQQLYISIAKQCVEFLALHEIYDVSEEDFFLKYHVKTSFFIELDKIQKKYEELKKYNREAIRELEAACKSKTIRDTLETSAYMDIYDWKLVLEEILTSHNITVCRIGEIQMEKAGSLFKNLKTLQLDREQRKKIAYQMLCEDPSEREYYEYCMLQFPEELGGLMQLAVIAGCEPNQECKKTILGKYYASLKAMDKLDEIEIKEQLEQISMFKKKLRYDVFTVKEDELQKRLKELDIIQRTVKGVLYDSREKAEELRWDYEVLNNLIKETKLSSLNLLDDMELLKIREHFLSADYVSDEFHNDSSYVLNEVNPLLEHQRNLQQWRKELLESREPWVTAEEIMQKSGVQSVLNEELKYADFDGIRKYCPLLLTYEKPVIYLQKSLFGWSNYLVITNKRALHIEKRQQISVEWTETTKIDYGAGLLLFSNPESGERISIRVRWPEEKIKYVLDVLKVLIFTLKECDEQLFKIAENDIRTEVNVQNQKEIWKGALKNSFASFLRSRDTEKQRDDVKNEIAMDKDKIQYCTHCGYAAAVSDRFCKNCGHKLC